LRFCFPEKISLIRRAGDVSPLIAIPAAHGDRRCLARAATGGTEKQNCKNRRLMSRGSPFSVTSTSVAGEARAKVKHINHNYVHNITNLTFDSTRAHDLSLKHFIV